MARPVTLIASGDQKTLQFKVVDDTGDAVNISAFSDIDVQVFAIDAETGEPTGAAIVSENLAGDVDLVGGGTTGLFSVAIVAADLASAAGDYWLEARLEDASNRFRTCAPHTLRVQEDLITS